MPEQREIVYVGTKSRVVAPVGAREYEFVRNTPRAVPDKVADVLLAYPDRFQAAPKPKAATKDGDS